MASVGYRCGRIGDYTGGNPRDAGVAWKALDYEYKTMGNDETGSLVRFLGIPSTRWPQAITEFRRRYPNTRGIWLSRSKQEAQRYRGYGDPEPVEYDERNIVVDLGGDGIFVLQGTALPDTESESESLLPTRANRKIATRQGTTTTRRVVNTGMQGVRGGK